LQVGTRSTTQSTDDETRSITGLGSVKRALKRHPLVVSAYTRWLEARTSETRTFAFVASTGRSGTNTLADLFDGLPRCVALHEPYPAMTTRPVDVPEDVWPPFSTKVVNILRAAAGNELYLETNHQFLKNFAEPAVAYFGDRIRVIHLVRDPISVASSFYSIGSIPGVSRLGMAYLLDPRRPDNVLAMGDAFEPGREFEHPLYRCLWYWYETEARVIRLRQQHPGLQVFSLRTDGLNDPGTVASLADFLGVPKLKDTLLTRTGLRSNLKRDLKKQSVSETEARDMNDRLLAYLTDRFGSAPVETLGVR
jgi:hypothetical protein